MKIYSLFCLLFVTALSACTTTEVKTPKSSWKIMTKNTTSNKALEKSNYVPSGTELLFTVQKKFTEKDNQINIELSPQKRCSLTTSFDKISEFTLTENSVLTVVGYRGETGELVLSEPNYQQYYISCLSKTNLRNTSSVAKKPIKNDWKKSSVEINDIAKMSPLLKVKFIPQ